MEDPYQPPKTEGQAVEAPSTIRGKRSRGFVLLLATATTLTGIVLKQLARRYSVALQSAEDAVFQDWLGFAWEDPELLFWCGLILGSLALAFLHLEKLTVALVLSLIGAGIILGWAAILALAVIN
jgi:hypothetical protein